jgi:hypothetical protein
LLVDVESEPIIRSMVIDDECKFSIQSDHNWIVTVVDAKYNRIEWPEVKKSRWNCEKLKGTGAIKFAKAFGKAHDSTKSDNLEEMDMNLLDSLNTAAEEVLGKKVAGKCKKKKPLPKPLSEAHDRWRHCEQEYAKALHDLPQISRKGSREKDLHQIKSEKIIRQLS